MATFGLWASLESWSQMALIGTLINIEVKNMNWTSHSWLLLWRTFEYTIQSRFTKWIQRLDGGWTYALDLSVGLKALMGSWVHSPYFIVLSCLGVCPRADTHSNMKWTFNFFLGIYQCFIPFLRPFTLFSIDLESLVNSIEWQLWIT